MKVMKAWMIMSTLISAGLTEGQVMEDTVFREYDIRGIVGTELRIEAVYDVARAIAYYFVSNNPGVKTVAVGMDGRTHSPAIKGEVCRALVDSGLDVIFVGVCTSPVVYFSLHEFDVQAGIMITASHNPKEYNGLKLELGHTTLWGKHIQTIRDYYKQGLRIISDHKGSVREEAVIPRYVAWLKQQFAPLVGMQMSVIVDCGNGAGGTVMPQLVEAMEWTNVALLYPEVDGNYPNHEADPSSEKNMRDLRNALATHGARIGIGLDGDCDRMGAMSQQGWLVPADRLLALFARAMVAQHPGMSVVMDINASDGLVEALKQCGAQPHFSPCGAAIVKTVMEEHQALVGGELSCHFFFADRHPGYDDGIYAMMRLLEIVQETQESLEAMLSFFPVKYSSPVVRVPCLEEKKFAYVEYAKNYFAQRSDVTLITIDGVRVYTPYGWALIRASNTQPMLSLRFEADSADDLEKIKKDVVLSLRGTMDVTELCNRLGIKDWRETHRDTYTVEQYLG